jgi:hypothetical protein|tara:strand:+ start:1526 stop:1753 length:228 start_codon:yes stop_codon:yes gene_type:complete
MEEYTDEQVAKDIVATMDSVSIVERVRAVKEADRTDDQKNELFRNERHIVLKMAIEKFVSGLSSDQKAKIDALSL